MTPRRLSRVLFGQQTSDVDQIASLAEGAWEHYQHARLGRAIAALPQLLRAAQALEYDDSQDSRARWATSARIHHLAATTLSKIGESDLAWIAAERAMGAADQSDDPLVLASAAHALARMRCCRSAAMTRRSNSAAPCERGWRIGRESTTQLR